MQARLWACGQVLAATLTLFQPGGGRLCPSHTARTYLQLPLRQCLPLSVVQLKGKHCRKLHCRNGVVDTFGPGLAQSCNFKKLKVNETGMYVYNIILPLLTL